MTTRAELRAEQADLVARLRDHPDEHHPDPRVAAAFADLNANTATQTWLEKQLRQIQARLDKQPTSHDLVHKGETERLLAIAKAERKDLEEVVSQWLPTSTS